MLHPDLMKQLALKVGYTERELKQIFVAYATLVREALVAGHDVNINGIGKLINKLCKAKKGRHPKTGEALIIPPKRRIRFKTCTALEMAMRAAGNPVKEDPLARFGLKENSDGEVRSSARSRERENRRQG